MMGLSGKRVLMLLINDVSHDQRIYRISKSLAMAGAEVVIFGRLLSQSKPIQWEHAKIYRFPIRPTHGPLMYLRLNLRFIKEARSRGAFDIVVSNDFDTLPAGYMLTRRKTSWVFDAHEHFIEVPELKDRFVHRNIWHGVGLFCVPKADLAYTVGQQLTRLLSLTYGNHFHTIPNYPEEGPKEYEVDRSKSMILYQGALNEGRGLEAAIEAMHQLEGMRLELAGEGDLSVALRQKVAQENLSDRVIFLGKLSPDRLRKKTRQAFIGLNLLDGSSLNYYYSLANKYFDYAAAGIPSLNMRFPEYEQMDPQQTYSLLIEDLNADEIAKQIVALKDDPDRYQTMCEAAHSFAEANQWSKVEKKLLSLYQAL
jgi:glycosyltransferase involved in cell wall biosynthesis